ncbi:class F sortase [Pseudonocardia sp. KRD291]|uniref:class F sortase n=1 Tax=Pseudonocardia sp. KRD291 TaxID=2792007 RepID=UPI001C49CE1E|nr:class F sortase [Pseudonocardia sp. KRD291]MBW0105388.1 sortase [Pseudonocardia sp. KRD291]
MSDRRRRPGTRGALFLLLLGVVSLGAGVLLHLYDSDERELVAQDLGSLPGATASASGPLAEDIPVLSGLDELLVRPDGPLPATGVSDLSGGFDTSPGPGPSAVDGGLDGGPAAGPDGATDPAGPPAPDAGGDVPDPSALTQAAPETRAPGTAVLSDPVPAPVARRPVPAAMPQAPAPLGPDLPGLLGPVYPLPESESDSESESGPGPEDGRPASAPLVPTSLELPARAVTAPVDPVGTDPSGGMVVPEQVRTVGWWAPGVLPGGASGSAVIAGHVDSRAQGVGFLSVLPQLTEGEPVLVRDASGGTAAFRVAARREYGKYDLPREVFRRDGAPQLVLITCGGRFDPAARSYESNIVVYAVPAAS